MENLNAVFIEEGLPQSERLLKLNRIAIQQIQLSSPLLPYDYILFDEGQDASPAMLDVFLKQDKAIKVIVGDTHQQIYAWRFAVNSMEKVDFRTFDLSVSFRFNQNLANLAMTYLGWKSYIGKAWPSWKSILIIQAICSYQ